METNQHMNRRDVLRRGAGAAAAAIAAGCGVRALYEKHPPLITAASATEEAFTLPSFRVESAAGGKTLALVHGSDDPTAMLEPALQALGGLERFIAKGDVVVVKPNVAFASPPLIGATSNPELVAEVVRRTLAAGASKVIVTDNPINAPDRCFAQSGVGPAAQQAGAQVMIPTESSFTPLTVPGGQLIRNWPFFAEPFRQANKVIGIAPVKDHTRAQASMSLKNWYGLLGGRRNQFHQDIHNIIKELAMMMTPTLVILDGTRVMMRNGPTGGSLDDLAARKTLIVATDHVAADAAGYELLDRSAEDLPYLRLATELKLGNYHYRELNHVEFNLEG